MMAVRLWAWSAGGMYDRGIVNRRDCSVYWGKGWDAS